MKGDWGVRTLKGHSSVASSTIAIDPRGGWPHGKGIPRLFVSFVGKHSVGTAVKNSINGMWNIVVVLRKADSDLDP